MQQTAWKLGNSPIPLNPNVTYRDLTSPQDREILAHLADPEVYANRIAALTKELAEKYADEGTYDDPKEAEAAAAAEAEVYGQKIKDHADYILETQVDFWNRPPIPFDRAASFSDHDKKMILLDQLASSKEDEDDPWDRAYRESLSKWNIIDPSLTPHVPWGYERTQEINKRGFNADPSNQIRFSENSVEDIAKSAHFNFLLSLAPRQLTKENYAHVGKKVGLDGEFLYINPNEPFKFGVAYRPLESARPIRDWDDLPETNVDEDGNVITGDSDDVQIVNSPQLSATDWWKVAQEAPSASLDVGATLWTAKKFAGPPGVVTGVATTITGKILQGLGLSGAAAIGATTGDLIRLMVGKKFDAHTLTWTEMAREAGIMGAWAFGGTAAVTLSTRAIVKAYKMIFNKDVPAALWIELDEIAKEAKGINIPTGMIYGPEITIQEIKDQVEYLVKEFNLPEAAFDDILTLGGGETAASLEILFLKNADNPKVKKLYTEFLKGNSKVIDNFIEALRKEIGPSIDKYEDALPGHLTKSVRKLLQQEIDLWEAKAEDIIIKSLIQNRGGVDDVIPYGQPVWVDDVIPAGGGGDDTARQQLPLLGEATARGGVDDVIPTGGGLLDNVAAPHISSKTFQRTQTQLLKAANQHKQEANDTWGRALNHKDYEDITTGASKTTAPTAGWIEANSARAQQIFADPQAQAALADLLTLAGPDSVAVLNRLMGRTAKGQFTNPKFTLNQLNDARVQINNFASTRLAGNPTAFKLARALERGLEEQIDVLVRNAASAKSMRELGLTKPLSEKELTEWIEQNKYGHDLSDAWKAQSDAYNLVETDLIQNLLRSTTHPEQVAEIIFASTVKGTGENTAVKNLMIVLKDRPEEVAHLQEGLIQHMRREILDQPGTPFQRASTYQSFIKEHEGVMKEVFGRRNKDGVIDIKDYKSRVQNEHAFQTKIIEPIEQANVIIKRLHQRFGSLVSGTSDTPILEIVENIIRKGEAVSLKTISPNPRGYVGIKHFDEEGVLLDDLQFLQELIGQNTPGSKLVAKQVATVFKRQLLNRIMTNKGGGSNWYIDEPVLNRLITEGFGPEQISSPRLTFENLLLPMLGKEEGEAFAKNLEVLNNMLLRLKGSAPSKSVTEGVDAWRRQGILKRIWQRIFQSPISVESRRTSVIIRASEGRSRSFIGRMLLDPELFEHSMQFAQGRESLQKFITILAAHDSIEARDLGNDLKYYDTELKKQTNLRDSDVYLEDTTDSRFNIPDRVLQLYLDTWDWGSDKVKDVFDDILGYFKDDKDIYDDEGNVVEDTS